MEIAVVLFCGGFKCQTISKFPLPPHLDSITLHSIPAGNPIFTIFVALKPVDYEIRLHIYYDK